MGDNLEPVWAEKWPSERLEERRREIGTLSFARAYRLVCIPEEDVPIRAEWVRFWVDQELKIGGSGHSPFLQEQRMTPLRCRFPRGNCCWSERTEALGVRG